MGGRHNLGYFSGDYNKVSVATYSKSVFRFPSAYPLENECEKLEERLQDYEKARKDD